MEDNCNFFLRDVVSNIELGLELLFFLLVNWLRKSGKTINFSWSR